MPVWTTITSDGDALPELAQPWWKWESVRPFGSVIGRVDAVPVSIARLFRARLELPNVVSVACVGIGGVFVEESFRNQRLAVQLMYGVRMQKDHYEFPLALFARDGRLYEDCGFVRIGEQDGQGVYWLQRGTAIVQPGPAWQLNVRF